MEEQKQQRRRQQESRSEKQERVERRMAEALRFARSTFRSGPEIAVAQINDDKHQSYPCALVHPSSGLRLRHLIAATNSVIYPL